MGRKQWSDHSSVQSRGDFKPGCWGEPNPLNLHTGRPWTWRSRPLASAGKVDEDITLLLVPTGVSLDGAHCFSRERMNAGTDQTESISLKSQQLSFLDSLITAPRFNLFCQKTLLITSVFAGTQSRGRKGWRTPVVWAGAQTVTSLCSEQYRWGWWFRAEFWGGFVFSIQKPSRTYLCGQQVQEAPLGSWCWRKVASSLRRDHLSCYSPSWQWGWISVLSSQSCLCHMIIVFGSNYSPIANKLHV